MGPRRDLSEYRRCCAELVRVLELLVRESRIVGAQLPRLQRFPADAGETEIALRRQLKRHAGIDDLFGAPLSGMVSAKTGVLWP